MLKKLTDEKLEEILEAGISEFADHGFSGAGMGAIAARAGISVGVLYKYYADKEDFFLACVRKSLGELNRCLNEVTGTPDKLLHYADRLIACAQQFARTHRDHIRMYHELTASSGRAYAKRLAAEIEGASAAVYTRFIEIAKKDGTVRRDLDPGLFAFFFDNLLMMLHFSYGCDYYRERLAVYCGPEIFEQDERVRRELLKFLESAFTLEQSQITHREG